MGGASYLTSPCLKCSARTPSPSGYCEPCRTVTCACGAKFIARKYGIPRCSNCRRNRAYHAGRMIQEVTRSTLAD